MATTTMTRSPRNLPRYDIDELAVGRLLGSGGFSCVFDVCESSPSLSSHDRKYADSADTKNDNTSPVQDETNESDTPPSSLDLSSVSSSFSFSESAYRRIQLKHRNGHESFSSDSSNSSENKWAIKVLHSKSLDNPSKVRSSVCDFQNEVEILAHLPPHENIIVLHAISNEFWRSPRESFMILERLEVPLDQIIKKWRKESQKGLSFWKKKHLGASEQAQRIRSVAVGLASAMSFLHEHLILYRDLKPSNVGIGQDGNVKLFDFGLARKLKSEKTRLVGRNGTLRYMAPECARSEMYGFSADVYSFAQVLWELLVLEKPFVKTKDKFELNLIVIDKQRHPFVHKISSPAIKDLLRQCWSAKPNNRPSFQHVVAELQKEVAQRIS